MNFSIIVAIAENMAIGKDNQLLWHISEDLKYFKNVTMGKPVVMGYNTWLSLPVKPLPERKNIVLTGKDIKDEPFIVAHNMEEVIKACQGEEECFVMGGGQVYKQFLPIVDRLYITWVHKAFDADIFFPEVDFTQWKELYRSLLKTDPKSGLEFDFAVYERML